jgi:hypothetical protein
MPPSWRSAFGLLIMGSLRRRKRGRPSYAPTDKDRKVVESMAAYGITQNEICVAIGIAPHTLRKYFADELATAHIKANARVSETAYNMAISGKCPAATFFWLKCRAGWRETTHLEHTGADGAPLAVIECIERVIVHEWASGTIIEGEAVADQDCVGLPSAP